MNHVLQPVSNDVIGQWPYDGGALVLGVGKDLYDAPQETVWFVKGPDHVASSLWRALLLRRVGTELFGSDLNEDAVISLTQTAAGARFRELLATARQRAGAELINGEPERQLDDVAGALERLVLLFPEISDGDAALNPESVCDRLLRAWQELRRSELIVAELARTQ